MNQALNWSASIIQALIICSAVRDYGSYCIKTFCEYDCQCLLPNDILYTKVNHSILPHMETIHGYQEQ